MNDPIVEEVRKARGEHAAQFNYNLDVIYADMKRIEAESDEPRVSFGPRRILNTTQAMSVDPTVVDSNENV